MDRMGSDALTMLLAPCCSVGVGRPSKKKDFKHAVVVAVGGSFRFWRERNIFVRF
jgi:hypothetical protein